MSDAEQIQRWARAETELRTALTLLRTSISDSQASFVTEFLDHNELGLAMDGLVEPAVASPAEQLPPEARRHLERASAEMGGYVPDEWHAFTERFM